MILEYNYVTFNLEYIGEDKLNKIDIFKELAIEINNTYKILDNETYCKVETFYTKKDALEFCKKWNLNKSLIRKVESRFQSGWIIGLGRNDYLPDLGEAYLIAKSKGYIVSSIKEDQRKYVNQSGV